MIDELKKRKQHLGLTNQDLAEMSGVPLGTVQKIMSGVTKAPRKETITALKKVLFSYSGVNESPIPLLEETVSPYMASKGNGEYTIEDYLALPEEARVELIDGTFYDMSAPTTIHQHLVVEIALQIRSQMSESDQDCLLLVAPVDVQLDMDDKTMVEPDILVLCDKSKLTKNRIIGAPDLVIEVLSPSTLRKDLYIKGEKYQKAGVKEYWMVDPDSQFLIQIDFTNRQPVHYYSFNQQVPVLISDGHCQVDFNVISRNLAMFFEETKV